MTQIAPQHNNAQSLLSLLMNGTDFADLKFKIEPTYFLLIDDKILWECLREQWEQEDMQFDISVIYREFRKKSKNAEPAAYITWILSGPLTENPNYYAREMILDYLRYELTQAIQKTNTAPDYADKALILKTKIDELEAIDLKGDRSFHTLGDIALNHMDYLQAKIEASDSYVTSGYEKLDEIVRFGDGHLVIFGGRSGMGKTMFMSNMVRWQVRAKKKIALFSLEMSKEEVFDMMLSQQTKIPYKTLRNPKDLNEQDFDPLYAGVMSQNPYRDYLTVSDDPGIDMDFLVRTAKDMHLSMGGLDAIWIDHIHLMKQKGFSNIREMFIYFSGALKQLAKELQIPVICLAQINREADKRPDKRPQIGDLKESSSLEADADSIIFAYREGFYNDTDKDGNEVDPTKCEIVIRKNRHGEKSNVSVSFEGDAVCKTIR